MIGVFFKNSTNCGLCLDKKAGVGKCQKLILATLLFLSLFPLIASASNLSITNAQLRTKDAAADTIKVQFDISWDNSWRDATNYDAAWVFVKYSTDNGSTWSHATLKTSGTNPTGFSIGSGTAIDIVVPTDKKGCFIQRSGNGTGTLSTTSVRLVWDYGTDGVSDSAANGSNTKIRVFGIEMAYIPQAAFYAGDSATGVDYSPLCTGSGTGQTTPWNITSEDLIAVEDCVSGCFYYGGASFNVPAEYPKGYNDFYLMKYPITEGQWVGFFNTLTANEQASRDVTDGNGKNSDAVVNRNTISWASGDATTTRSDRAMSYIWWGDVCAYADWAALRPWTDLEREKAGRGTNSAVASEAPWGSTSVTKGATLSGTEDGTETFTDSGANVYANGSVSGGDGGSGPVRVGIFATGSSNRETSGAGYYGNMDMTGNLVEFAATIDNETGRGFQGTHGDGVLTTHGNGNADVMDWPGYSHGSGEIDTATGSGFFAYGYANTDNNARSLSHRGNAGTAQSGKGADYGGRLARTAP